MSHAPHQTTSHFPLKDFSSIAYLLMEYPRVSESFIINEIYQLERMGASLQLFSVKKPKDAKVHETVNKIGAPVTYLPSVTSLSGTPFREWLKTNLPAFLSAHCAIALRRPLAYVRVLGEAIGMMWRYREPEERHPRKVFFKEFLQAGAIAHHLLNANPFIRHIHSHFCHGTTTIAMFTSRLTGLPFSFTAHAKDIFLKSLNPGDLLQRKRRRATFLVTCTDANRHYLNTICPDGAPIHTIYHGLAPDVFSPTSGSPSQPPLILSVGRFVEKKGFACLVEACRILRDQGHAFQCHLIGDPGDSVTGDMTPIICSMIEAWNLQDVVHLKPSVTQAQLRLRYQECTIFTLPCQILDNGDRDGIPNVLAEAMATGLPVVSTEISGIPELVTHRHNGLLIPQKDAQALAEALAELLRNPALRTSLGQAARETICRIFDSQQTTIRLKTLFDPLPNNGSYDATTVPHESVCHG
ncbi:MAG: glycosyltransferase [Nitrospirota bacterium]|nr:glycosyltransferase [Nitrospirota bacterium]